MFSANNIPHLRIQEIRFSFHSEYIQFDIVEAGSASTNKMTLSSERQNDIQYLFNVSVVLWLLSDAAHANVVFMSFDKILSCGGEGWSFIVSLYKWDPISFSCSPSVWCGKERPGWRTQSTVFYPSLSTRFVVFSCSELSVSTADLGM